MEGLVNKKLAQRSMPPFTQDAALFGGIEHLGAGFPIDGFDAGVAQLEGVLLGNGVNK